MGCTSYERFLLLQQDDDLFLEREREGLLSNLIIDLAYLRAFCTVAHVLFMVATNQLSCDQRYVLCSYYWEFCC